MHKSQWSERAFFSSPFQAGIKDFFPAAGATPGSQTWLLCVFSSWICYVNLGRLFSLPVLVSLQSLVSLAGKCMSGLMAVQRSPKSKRHQIFAKTEVIRLALFAATLLFPSKYPFTLNQGVSYTLLNWDHLFLAVESSWSSEVLVAPHVESCWSEVFHVILLSSNSVHRQLWVHMM